jgi:uncharacterized protein (DUF983 family)
MIFNLLINVVLAVFGYLFTLLPVVTIASIPIVGSFVSSALYFAVEIWNSFMVTFPYAQLVWHVFIYVILPFEILMLIGKFFLGHRMPNNTN